MSRPSATPTEQIMFGILALVAAPLWWKFVPGSSDRLVRAVTGDRRIGQLSRRRGVYYHIRVTFCVIALVVIGFGLLIHGIIRSLS